MERILKISNLFVASLRAIYLVHQHSHWKTKGICFYGDHLVFERLYKSAQENADLAAEKFIGLFGDDAVDYETQNSLIGSVMGRYSDFDDETVSMSLAIEKEFLKFAQEAYEAFEEEGAMTLGLDDTITAIASKREEACYLLQQISN